jgi:hypothetical protein
MTERSEEAIQRSVQTSSRRHRLLDLERPLCFERRNTYSKNWNIFMLSHRAHNCWEIHPSLSRTTWYRPFTPIGHSAGYEMALFLGNVTVHESSPWTLHSASSILEVPEEQLWRCPQICGWFSHVVSAVGLGQWYSIIFVRVPTDVISL